MLSGGISPAEFDRLTTGLGKIRGTTAVRIDPAVPTYLCGDGAVPFHTDDPRVDVIAWYCEEQDERDGACLLVDSRDVVGRMTSREVDELRGLELRYRGATEPRPVLTEDGSIFFAPWLCPGRSGGDVLNPLRRAIGEPDCHDGIEVRLQPGQVLIIDNHRTLHGRRAISDSSRRQLVRRWITSS